MRHMNFLHYIWLGISFHYKNMKDNFKLKIIVSWIHHYNNNCPPKKKYYNNNSNIQIHDMIASFECEKIEKNNNRFFYLRK